MKLNFSKKEYKALLEVLQIADWVLHSFKTEPDPETAGYRDLAQKLLASAADMGFKHLVRQDARTGRYLPSPEFADQSTAHKFIDAYNTEYFWSELVERLALRDLIRQQGLEAVQALDMDGRLKMLAPLRSRYYKTFQQAGIECLQVEHR